MSNGTEVKEQTLNGVLAECHQVCMGIEERLCTIIVSAPSKEPSDPEDEVKPRGPDTIVDLLGQDHLRAVALCRRLHRLDEHVVLVQERLKVLA